MKLWQVAKLIRSKNAGPFEITFDVMFDQESVYQLVKRSGVINAARIAQLYNVRHDDEQCIRPL